MDVTTQQAEYAALLRRLSVEDQRHEHSQLLREVSHARKAYYAVVDFYEAADTEARESTPLLRAIDSRDSTLQAARWALAQYELANAIDEGSSLEGESNER